MDTTSTPPTATAAGPVAGPQPTRSFGQRHPRLRLALRATLGLVAILFAISAALGGRDSQIDSFADDLRDEPGITSVVALGEAERPAGAAAVLKVDGDAAQIVFADEGSDTLSLRWEVRRFPVGVDYQQTISRVAKQQGFE